MEGIRLQKYLARCGLGSRRRCEEIIKSGEVTINGRIAIEMGTRVQKGDSVRYRGRDLQIIQQRYFILNKPKGILCVDKDQRGRKYVVDLIPDGRKLGLFPVGRLDMDTTGLIILTNDGDLSNRISHPRYGVEKEYRALIKGNWTFEDLRARLKDGVILENGEKVENIGVISVERVGERTRVLIRIHEGRKHVVRRIFLSIGSRVYELHRTMIGELDIKDIKTGDFLETTRSWIMDGIVSQGRSGSTLKE